MGIVLTPQSRREAPHAFCARILRDNDFCAVRGGGKQERGCGVTKQRKPLTCLTIILGSKTRLQYFADLCCRSPLCAARHRGASGTDQRTCVPGIAQTQRIRIVAVDLDGKEWHVQADDSHPFFHTLCEIVFANSVIWMHQNAVADMDIFAASFPWVGDTNEH